MLATLDWFWNLPPWLRELAVKLAIAGGLMLPFVSFVAMFSIWLERKVAGHIQSRHGPNRVGGFHGWAQSIADGMKLMLKEDLIPRGADTFLFRLGPYLAFAPALAAYLFLAWSRDLSGLTGQVNAGVFFLLAVLGVEVIGVILAGWGSNNKWSVYGAMREACQMICYEIPLGLAIITAVLAAGTLNLLEISLLQRHGITHWLLFHDPFNALAFVLYYIAALASCKRAPFDLPESESELVAGYHTEYSGMRFSFFFFAEYAAMFVVSGIQTTLWLGAWYDPFGIVGHFESLRVTADGTIVWPYMIAANALGATVFIGKAFLLVYVQIWLRWTLPRLRIDQVLYLCIKVLLPLACVNLVGAASYQWLTEPMPLVQRTVQTTLTVLGAAAFAALLAFIAHAYLTRAQRTFRTMP
jgi:NADH-quinone oxidoreductase subunit H